jgi:hypothetical protein
MNPPDQTNRQTECRFSELHECHRKEPQRSGSLSPFERVSFEVEPGNIGKGPKIVN